MKENEAQLREKREETILKELEAKALQELAIIKDARAGLKMLWTYSHIHCLMFDKSKPVYATPNKAQKALEVVSPYRTDLIVIKQGNKQFQLISKDSIPKPEPGHFWFTTRQLAELFIENEMRYKPNTFFNVVCAKPEDIPDYPSLDLKPSTNKNRIVHF